MNEPQPPPIDPTPPTAPTEETTVDLPVCPVCGGHLIDIRQKWVCERCHTICQTCCEGGRG